MSGELHIDAMSLQNKISENHHSAGQIMDYPMMFHLLNEDWRTEFKAPFHFVLFGRPGPKIASG